MGGASGGGAQLTMAGNDWHGPQHGDGARSAAAIEVQSIRRRFGELVAVDGVSFSVAQGEIFGLLGPNGAGKSTLIRMLTTLVEPSGGSAQVAGHDVARDPNGVRLRIGVIPQNMTSDPDLTCAETLSIQARLYGLAAARRKQITTDLLAMVGLGERAGSLVKTLSGGMRRRLEIARGLV
ncbi:MAG: ABC transporter ATP-binding protein, partial [Terriglobales bacterium]